ncbi:MAG: PAS domain-containing sensor histidine kinase, partial [Elusimicrobiota bacterium]|nr:PAS domain-containing sensor histidine kinase [Elusimicrobiota bacterium]
AAGGGPGGGKAAEGPVGGKPGGAMFGPGAESGTGGGPGGAKAAEGPGGGKARENLLANMSFGGILKGLVESAVKDPKDRIRAYEDALKTLKETMEQQVAESTRALAAEKEAAINTRTRTEHVLSKVADGKVIIDKDGKILMMNPAAEEIAGTKLADAVRRHISEHHSNGEHFHTLSKDMDLTGGKIISGEVEVKGDENMGRTMRRSVAMLVDAEGRVVGELSTLPEITKYKDAQRMQEEFLSRVTHDLQSPLSSISSALEMLTEAAAKKLDPMESKFLDISIRNSHRLSQMIRGILDFSKLQSGKMDVHPVPTLLTGILNEAVEGLMPWAKTKGITLNLRPVAEDLCALADPPRIVQVITNLISNAIKATQEGGSVTVAASPSPGRDGSVLIGVRDTGHGIPKEDLSKLFQKFVQLDSRQSMDGVGLGLVIVNDFLKLHNGKIWADSDLGKGSTFYFTLPAAKMKQQFE